MCIAVVVGAVLLAGAMCACAQEAAGAPEKSTLDNLMAAYNGEMNANARYLAFAVKADEEGYGAAASLLRAAARAEQVHFERHAKVITDMGGKAEANIETPEVKSTLENLQAAMNGEIYESTDMYPKFVAKAEKDKLPEAVDAFEDAMKAEAVHANWYKTAINELASWKIAKKDFYVCPKCGNVVDVLEGPSCPICMTDTKKFMPVS